MSIVSYLTFMKHAKKVTKTASKSRPVLQGVNHRGGDIAVTDSHRLYYATDMFEGEEKNVCPKTGAIIDDGVYPDVARLIPDKSDAKFNAIIEVDKASKAVKLIEQAGNIEKASDLITIKRNVSDIAFSTDEKSLVKCEYVMYNDSEGDTFELHATARYVKEAFELFKDAGFTQVSFNYYGSLRPFTLTAGNLTALISPVRKQ